MIKKGLLLILLLSLLSCNAEDVLNGAISEKIQQSDSGVTLGKMDIKNDSHNSVFYLIFKTLNVLFGGK